MPAVYNFFVGNKVLSGMAKRILGFAKKRSLPKVYKTTLRRWARKNLSELNPTNPIKTVCLFTDEFTNYNDTNIGIEAIQLLTALNYRVELPAHSLSGRTYLSKGLLRKARKIAIMNIEMLSAMIDEDTQLLGIEPSAILGFRDEFPDLVPAPMFEKAEKLASNALLIDEFISAEFKRGNISSDSFKILSIF